MGKEFDLAGVGDTLWKRGESVSKVELWVNKIIKSRQIVRKKARSVFLLGGGIRS